MARMGMDELFYGRPEPVRIVGGRGGGYGSLEYGHGHQLGGRGPHYYSDGDDYYNSHRRQINHAPLFHSSGAPMLPDVQLSVPMDSHRCVAKIKEALSINGVYSVHCDVPSQTVTVSGNVAPQALLKRAKHVKRKSKILSYSSPGLESSSYGSSFQRPSYRVSHTAEYGDAYRRPSHEHHYSTYY